MQNPLVSIIIPTYNRAHLIGETLDSVLAQTYTNWECIVVDDGSTDTTDEVLKKYCKKDKRIKYFHRPTEHLPYGNGARNYGFKQSIGKYLNYLDSDDILHENTLEIKVVLALKHNCNVIISGHTNRLEEFGSRDDSKPKIIISNNFDFELIKIRKGILIGDPMFKRELMEEVQFNEELIKGQDQDFFMRLFRLKNKYCLIKNKFYYCKFTLNSITNRAGLCERDMINTTISIHKKMISHYKKYPEIIFEIEREKRKIYKKLMGKNKILLVLKNYNYFRKAFHLNFFIFTFYFLINLIFTRGYDKIKYNI